MSSKLEELRKLAAVRRCDRLDGYFNLSEIFNGRYDSRDYVTPFTKSASNINSDVMLIAQDWSSIDSLSKLNQVASEELIVKGYSESLPTNKRLKTLLKNYLNCDFSDAYATNLFVFIKEGSISAKIKKADLIYSAQNYTLPEISIVKPKIVICLGATVFKIMSRLINDQEVALADSINTPLIYAGAYVLGVPHPGGLGTAAAGGDAAVAAHWEKIRDFCKSKLS